MNKTKRKTTSKKVGSRTYSPIPKNKKIGQKVGIKPGDPGYENAMKTVIKGKKKPTTTSPTTTATKKKKPVTKPSVNSRNSNSGMLGAAMKKKKQRKSQIDKAIAKAGG